MKPILDACCGGRMFWHDKKAPGVVFMDCRTVADHEFYPGRRFAVQPDVVGDFRAMPFDNGTFRLVVFDPPHRRNAAETSITGLKYGSLGDDWQNDIRAGFTECFRVLDPTGFLIFKWAEASVKVAELLCLAPRSPLFGTRTGKSGSTHWLTFAAN